MTSSDVAWLSSLVGMNLTGSPNTLGEQSQELTQSTAERLSDLAQATEQVHICLDRKVSKSVIYDNL